MRELSLFTGAGGGVYASKLLGHEIVGYVEFNEYCQKIIKQRIIDGIFDDAPIFGDIREFDGSKFCNSVDLVSGGFPCQPFSVAGRKKGKDDSRNMWPETIRVIKQVKPKKAFLENVPGLLSSGYFGQILNDLSEAGYDAKWITLSAADCGAPHKRERLWILADSNQLKNYSIGRVNQFGWDPVGRDTKTAQQKHRPSSHDSISRCSETLPNTNGKRLERQRESSRLESEQSRTRNDRINGWWAVEPDVGRVVNGMANRKHRLTALGNGQVSIVAAKAFTILNNELDRIEHKGD